MGEASNSRRTLASLLASDSAVKYLPPCCNEAIDSGNNEKRRTQCVPAGILHNGSGDSSTASSRESFTCLTTQVSSGPSSRDTATLNSEESLDSSTAVNGFKEMLEKLQLRDRGQKEMPENLTDVLLDQHCVISSLDLNFLLFSPNSKFWHTFLELQSASELVEGHWELKENLNRVLTYAKPGKKFFKAVKVVADQTYLKADGKSFAILEVLTTPDVPYGSCFTLQVLYRITSGTELPSGEKTCHILVSLHVNFLESTIMKGLIERNTKQGFREQFEQFSNLLAKTIKLRDLRETGSDKERILAPLKMEQESDWKLARRILGNSTVLSTIFIGLFVFLHMMVTKTNTRQGFEFDCLDMPDSIGEALVSIFLFLQGRIALEMVSRFMRARTQKGSDHGVKAQGDGWLLTVALIEGTKLPAVDSLTGFSDPYVVFTCGGKTKASSVKFQTVNPQWNEVFAFDAMQDPPSVMDIEVCDFDGPSNESISLGRAEVNFLTSNLEDLANMWIPLKGKLAHSCNSKLHLRVFLNNTKGTEVAKEYVSKMEKEVGKRINMRSAQENTSFQKLFGLPSEEFLINDFACHLKRKMPLQGRLFLSSRLIGFYAKLFGCRTKFFFLWEDVEDIQVLPPTLTSVGSPSLMIVLRRDRGMDAKHGAKSQDEEGRLRFHFQSFVFFQTANKTIMALWRARSSGTGEEQSRMKPLITPERSFIVDSIMKEIHSSQHSIQTNALMEVFAGGFLEIEAMEKTGCIDYTCTEWELIKPDIRQRKLSYKLEKSVSHLGGEVNSIQQIFFLDHQRGWWVDEVMTLRDIPLSDYFNIHLKYQAEDAPSRSNACIVQVYMSVQWLKNTRHRKRISKSIELKLSDHLKKLFDHADKKLLPVIPPDPLHGSQST